jgi:GNAT superfamily N-acetyltransferase
MEIRQYRPEDFPALLRLVEACYGAQAEPPEWWRWRHFEHPGGPASIWLAVEGGQVVGMRPISFFPYFLDGVCVKGGLFSAVMVHPKFRRQGIFSRLVHQSVETAWRTNAVFVATMPNDLSYAGFQKGGWTDLGDRTLYVRVTDWSAVLRSKGAPRWIASLVRPRGVSLAPSDSARDFRVETVDRFDLVFEDFTLELGRQWRGVTLNRTSDWLNWRYESHPWNNYTRLIARSAEGQPLGFLVTNLERRAGLQIGYIVDLLARAEAARRSLISAAVENLRRQGAHVIAAVLYPGLVSGSLCAGGFRRMSGWISPKKFHTVCLLNPACADRQQRLTDWRNWYLTLGDWDGI